MSNHDTSRAKARRAVDVASKRSAKKAAMKRTMTMTVKAAAGTAAIATGTYAVNRYLSNHQVTLNGNRVQFSRQNVNDVVDLAKKAKNLMGYFV